MSRTVGLRGCAALVVALAVAACGSYLRRGTTLYDEGRYIEAADVFAETEPLLDEADERERAEYAAYRGLTLLGLGDLRNAERWMAYAYEVERTHPGSLREEDLRKLGVGWATLHTRFDAAPPQTPTPATAVAASQPPRPVPAPRPVE